MLARPGQPACEQAPGRAAGLARRHHPLPCKPGRRASADLLSLSCLFTRRQFLPGRAAFGVQTGYALRAFSRRAGWCVGFKHSWLSTKSLFAREASSAPGGGRRQRPWLGSRLEDHLRLSRQGIVGKPGASGHCVPDGEGADTRSFLPWQGRGAVSRAALQCKAQAGLE